MLTRLVGSSIGGGLIASTVVLAALFFGLPRLGLDGISRSSTSGTGGMSFCFNDIIPLEETISTGLVVSDPEFVVEDVSVWAEVFVSEVPGGATVTKFVAVEDKD